MRLAYFFALGLACLMAVGIAIQSWRNRERSEARGLLGVAVATAIWTGGTIGLMASSSVTPGFFWLRFMNVGIIGAPVAFLLLALEYTDQEHVLTLPFVSGLLLLGALFLGLVWTNSLHHLYWAEVDYTANVPRGVDTTPAIGFWGFIAFAYSLLLVGSALFVHYVFTVPQLYRSQTTAILIAVAIPWAANVPHSLQLIDADYTPIALSVTSVALWVGMFRYRLTDLSPIALRAVFESIETGVFVLDAEERIADVNAAGKDMLGVSDDAIGEDFRDVIPADSLYEPFREADGARHTIAVDGDGSSHPEEVTYYEVQVTPIEASPGRKAGHLFVVDDVSSRERQRDRLERQNTQLEEFTSVVSHDLRNPLNVASGNVALAREECDSDFLDRADRALSRMATLIDDLLVLARGGQTITELEPVDLAEVVDAAWETVETKQATLVNEASNHILADRSRLHQLIENLIRNAVEHGGPSVTISVGGVEDGFYVSDDGKGVPANKREEIFEAGYSTNEDGTGFGLSIVRKIAEAHGWTITLTKSSGSGARFELRNVEHPEQ